MTSNASNVITSLDATNLLFKNWQGSSFDSSLGNEIPKMKIKAITESSQPASTQNLRITGAVLFI